MQFQFLALDSAGKPAVRIIGNFQTRSTLYIQVQTPGTLRISNREDALIRGEGLQLDMNSTQRPFRMPGLKGPWYGIGSGPLQAEIVEQPS